MVAKGRKTEEISYSPLKGVGICKVLAVNPSKSEMENIYKRTFDNDPVYVGEREINDKTVPTIRITFVCETTSLMLPEPVILPVAFFLSKSYRYNAEHTKVQVIDAYGRTAWATKEEVKAKTIPMYKNGKANISEGYRVALDGEQELTEFLQALINIPSVQRYNKNTGEWHMVEHPEDSESRLDSINDYFTGDVSELRDIVQYQPENQVRVMFGSRVDKEGRLRQTTYNRLFLRLYDKNYNKFKDKIEADKALGYLADSDFVYGNLRKSEVTPTDISTPEKAQEASVDDDLPEDTMPAQQEPSDNDGDDLPFEL